MAGKLQAHRKEEKLGKAYEGMLIGEGLKFGLVVSRFNELITSKLLEGARDALSRHGVKDEDVEIAKTPGAFEIPLVAKKMAQTGKYDGIICLGAVIRGGTPHFDYIASQVSKGIASTSLELGLPITFKLIKSKVCLV